MDLNYAFGQLQPLVAIALSQAAEIMMMIVVTQEGTVVNSPSFISCAVVDLVIVMQLSFCV